MRDSVSTPFHGCSVTRAAKLWLALCGLGLATTVHAGQAVPSAPGPDFAQQVLALINAQRTTQGLPAWQLDPALNAIASEHSRVLAAQGRLSHEGFNQRFAHANRDSCVENLAAGLLRPEALVAAWRVSPAHQHNLFAPALRYAGIGQFNGYVALLACD
jgi:uncharacterized protein YkwD